MNMDNTKKEFDRTTIGSDPEFLVQISGKTVNARSFFSSLSGRVDYDEDFWCENCEESGGGNCDECTNNEEDDGVEIDGSGNIGWDGNDTVGEMRPDCSKSPYGHAVNIAALLGHVATRNRAAKLAAVNQSGEYVTPTGGHIHLGLPEGVGRMDTSFLYAFSALMLPIVFADGSKDYAKKRINNRASNISDESWNTNSYGSIRDWRHEVRGECYVYEFRTLTSAWLATRQLAEVTLATAGAIWDGLLILFQDKPEEYKALLDKVKPYSDNLNGLQRLALLDSEGKIFVGISNRLKGFIKELPTYEKWKKEITLATTPGWQAAQAKRGAADILEGWNLKNHRRVPLYKVLGKFMVPESEASSCLKTYGPKYNNDLNVATFAMEMAKASKVTGWSTSKTFFLYGIKQGAETYVAVNGNGEAFVTPGCANLTRDNLHKARTFAESLGSFNSRTTVAEKRNFIAVGIPYGKRFNHDVKGFLEMIWKLDNDSIKMDKDWSKFLPASAAAEPDPNYPDLPAVCAAS